MRLLKSVARFGLLKNQNNTHSPALRTGLQTAAPMRGLDENREPTQKVSRIFI